MIHAPHPAAVAVLINAKARRVTPAFVQAARALVGERHVYLSQTLEQAQVLAQQILTRGYPTVVCGGGDGTLFAAFAALQRLRAGGIKAAMPRLAFLSLGTGNGLQKVVGATQPELDLRTLAEGRAAATLEVPLMRWQGTSFSFGGLGYDSLLLGDYTRLQARTDHPLLRPLFHGVLGYFTALFSQTLGKALLQAPLMATVRSRSPATLIDPRRGDVAVELPAGEPLFAGPVSMIGMGTTPFYGYGLRMFPFAGMRPDKMQLRIACLSPLRALGVLPQIWRGSYRHPRGIFDFCVADVQVQLSRPHPFQTSGDDRGNHQDLDVEMAAEGLRLVDFYRAEPAR